MENYLDSVRKQFEYYKMLGEKTFSQIPDEALFWAYNEESNSIAVIVKHLWGNMRSRWTNFMSEDGEKSWRDRDGEFEPDIRTKSEMMEKWHAGWQCLFDAIGPLSDNDLEKIIYIRNQGHTVMEAINRQLAHYPYHIGQIVFIGKMAAGKNWQTLSIARGKSGSYNADKFARPKEKSHFTDEYLKPGNNTSE